MRALSAPVQPHLLVLEIAQLRVEVLSRRQEDSSLRMVPPVGIRLVVSNLPADRVVVRRQLVRLLLLVVREYLRFRLRVLLEWLYWRLLCCK